MKPELPKNITFLLAALYVAGLWITQMHLGRYGIPGLAFSDTRYFFTGMWLFLSLLPTLSWIGVVEVVVPRREALVPRVWAVCAIAAPIALWIAVLTTMTLSSQNDPITVELAEFQRDFGRTTKDTAVWFLVPWIIDLILIVTNWVWRTRPVAYLVRRVSRNEPDGTTPELVSFRARRQPLLVGWLIFCCVLHSFSYLTWLHEDIKQAYGGGASFYGCIQRDGKSTTLASVVYETESTAYYVGTYHPDPFRKLNATEICDDSQAETGTNLRPDVVYRAKAEHVITRSTSSPND